MLWVTPWVSVIYWGEKEHKSRCRNTNPSLPLLTTVCIPALPLAQNFSSLFMRHSILATSPGHHGWNAITICMLNASFPHQYAICLVDASCLEHRFHATLGNQWLNLRYEARRAQGTPSLHHPHLRLESCSSLEGSGNCAGKPGCVLYSIFLNFSLRNVCTMILMYLRQTAIYAAERVCMHPIHLLVQGHGAQYSGHPHYWDYQHTLRYPSVRNIQGGK